jgi:hypothetical protein
MTVVTTLEATVFMGYGPVRKCPKCGKTLYTHVMRRYKSNVRPMGIPMYPGDGFTLHWWICCGHPDCKVVVEHLLPRRQALAKLAFTTKGKQDRAIRAGNHRKIIDYLLQGFEPTKRHIDKLSVLQRFQLYSQYKGAGIMEVWYQFKLGDEPAPAVV